MTKQDGKSQPDPQNKWQNRGTIIGIAVVVVLVGYTSYTSYMYYDALDDAQTFFADGKYREAILAADRAISYDDDHADAPAVKAHALFYLNKPAEAFRTIVPFAESSRATPYLLFDAAEYAYYSDTLAAAYYYIGRSLAGKDDYAPSWYLAGDIYADRRDYDSAIVCYTKSLVLKITKRANVWVAMGNAYDNSGQLAKALEYYDKAIDYSADYADAYYQKGIALYNAGRTGEAEIEFRRAKSLGAAGAAAYLRKMNPQ